MPGPVRTFSAAVNTVARGGVLSADVAVAGGGGVAVGSTIGARVGSGGSGVKVGVAVAAGMAVGVGGIGVWVAVGILAAVAATIGVPGGFSPCDAHPVKKAVNMMMGITILLRIMTPCHFLFVVSVIVGATAAFGDGIRHNRTESHAENDAVQRVSGDEPDGYSQRNGYGDSRARAHFI